MGRALGQGRARGPFLQDLWAHLGKKGWFLLLPHLPRALAPSCAHWPGLLCSDPPRVPISVLGPRGCRAVGWCLEGYQIPTVFLVPGHTQPKPAQKW